MKIIAAPDASSRVTADAGAVDTLGAAPVPAPESTPIYGESGSPSFYTPDLFPVIWRMPGEPELYGAEWEEWLKELPF